MEQEFQVQHMPTEMPWHRQQQFWGTHLLQEFSNQGQEQLNCLLGRQAEVLQVPQYTGYATRAVHLGAGLGELCLQN